MTIKIVDTTLRDGEQTPGVLFSLSEKIEIASLLDQAGVHAIEAGTPANGKLEQLAIKEILNRKLNADIIVWNRALKSDLDRSLAIGADFIHASLPVSNIMITEKLRKSKQWILKQLSIIGDHLRQEGVRFSVGAEDATRADHDFLLEYGQLAKELGATRLRLCDTIGISDPFAIVDLVKAMDCLELELEIHAHNDLGMATANALAAAKAGACVIDTTVIGLGERAGNTPLEEIIMALRLTMQMDVGINLNLMKNLASVVSIAAGRPISEGKSVVGESIFSHESGIHVDGIKKNPKTYEPYHPKLVGAIRKIVIGKHSGPKAVIQKIEELGGCNDSKSIDQAVPIIRRLAAKQKGGVSDQQILQIVHRNTYLPQTKNPVCLKDEFLFS